jgi:hypothetical protein
MDESDYQFETTLDSGSGKEAEKLRAEAQKALADRLRSKLQEFQPVRIRSRPPVKQNSRLRVGSSANRSLFRHTERTSSATPKAPLFQVVHRPLPASSSPALPLRQCLPRGLLPLLLLLLRQKQSILPRSRPKDCSRLAPMNCSIFSQTNRKSLYGRGIRQRRENILSFCPSAGVPVPM